MSKEEQRETWFEVYTVLNRITAVRVDKVTENFVVIGGRRQGRYGTTQFYEPTLEQAKAKLIEYHELLVGKAASMFEVRKADLERARNPQVKELAEQKP